MIEERKRRFLIHKKREKNQKNSSRIERNTKKWGVFFFREILIGICVGDVAVDESVCLRRFLEVINGTSLLYKNIGRLFKHYEDVGLYGMSNGFVFPCEMIHYLREKNDRKETTMLNEDVSSKGIRRSDKTQLCRWESTVEGRCIEVHASYIV